jgi:hypothetical protein
MCRYFRRLFHDWHFTARCKAGAAPYDLLMDLTLDNPR